MTRLKPLLVLFINICLVQCTPVRTQEATKTPNAFISVNIKKNNETSYSELSNQESIVVGVNSDNYRSVLLKYKELEKVVSTGILWSLETSAGKAVEIVGITYGVSQDGFLITIDESIFIPFTEKRDFLAVVKRNNTVLSILTVSVSKYIPPTLQSITLTRKSNHLATTVNIGQTIDLSTIFNYKLFPEKAEVSSFVWSVQNDIGTIAEGTTLFTAQKEGVASITIRSDSKPIVTSAITNLQCIYNNKSFKLKDVFFPIDLLPADKQLVAWHQYTSSNGTTVNLNLGLLTLNSISDPTSSIKAEVTSDDYIISSKILVEKDSKFIITLESTTNDPLVVAALTTPSKTIIFSEAVNNASSTLPLNFLGTTDFSTSGTDGQNSSLIAYTPSDNPTTVNNDFQGVWFVKDSMPSQAGLQAISSLNLPILATSGQWIYEGWVTKTVTNGSPINISLGKFYDPTKVDFSKYYFSGSNIPKFPGEDLLVNRGQGQVGYLFPDPFGSLDVRNYKVVISLEPSSDLAKEDLTLGFLKILETSVSKIGIDKPQQFENVMIPSAKLEIKN